MRTGTAFAILMFALLSLNVNRLSAQSVADTLQYQLHEGALKSKVDSLRLSMSRQQSASASLLASRADSLRRSYDFAAAVKLFEQALGVCPDSLASIRIDDALTHARNGLNMMSYCSRPKVLAKRRLPIEEFFLYYPMQDSSWRSVPNCLDTTGRHPLVRANYLPLPARQLYFSAPDSSGVNRLYYTEYKDTAWSVPGLVDEELNDAEDVIFPMLNHDGKSLYFSSDGLYGMGGYDLYVSNWNEKTKSWDLPANLGFPYSSPFDDFLYYNTPDGLHTLFASNRECTQDSVWLYVLEYDTLPLHSAVDDPRELRALVSMEPQSHEKKSLTQPAQPESDDVRVYLDQMNDVRELRDSLAGMDKILDSWRAEFALATTERKSELSSSILDKEMSMIKVQRELEEAMRKLQMTEMQFLDKGAVIDADSFMDESSRDKEAVRSQYEFTRLHLGDSLSLKFLAPLSEQPPQ